MEAESRWYQPPLPPTDESRISAIASNALVEAPAGTKLTHCAVDSGNVLDLKNTLGSTLSTGSEPSDGRPRGASSGEDTSPAPTSVVRTLQRWMSRDELAARDETGAGDGDGDDVEDNEVVFLTDAYRVWECHYLRRLAKKIHRLVCSQLEHRSEEALFMLFVDHDKDMDGTISADEAIKLLELIEQTAPGADCGLAAEDGTISFTALLNWYSGATGGQPGKYRETNTTFNLTSLTVGVLGSGMMSSDARLDKLDWAVLRRTIVGYRQMLTELRSLQEDRALKGAREAERKDGIFAAMPLYYAVLAREFEGDMEHLFELFCEVDASNNMMLETKEVEKLMCLLDTGATKNDLARYVSELNMNAGPLPFASFIDWWDQSRRVTGSLVSEKGAGLLAGIRAQALKEKVGGFFFETACKRRWNQAKEDDRLLLLRQAYCKTITEVREYKMNCVLQAAESECAAL